MFVSDSERRYVHIIDIVIKVHLLVDSDFLNTLRNKYYRNLEVSTSNLIVSMHSKEVSI